MGIKVNLKNVRISGLHVFEKDSPKKAVQKPAYRVFFLIDKDDEDKIAMLTEAATQAMNEATKDEEVASRWLKKNLGFNGFAPNDCAIWDGDEMENGYESSKGKFVVSSKSFKQPRVLSSERERLVKVDETEDGDTPEGKAPYSGCYANVSVEFWGQWDEKGKGLRCNILGLKFVKDGEAFGGAGESATDEDLDDEDEAPKRKSRR